MNIRIITSYFGGPYQWGCGLSRALRMEGYQVKHTHTLLGRIWDMLIKDCDLVHTTVPSPIELWKIPTVATIKGDYTIEHNIMQAFYPNLVNSADFITTPSHYIKNRLGIERMIVIPNALFPEDARIADHKSGGKLHIATIMNFYFAGKSKGSIRMLDLLASRKFSDLLLLVVGEGPYLQQVKDYAHNINLDIRFTEYLPDPYMVLYNSDLFLYYSLHDNFPNVILEAMAAGLPVLTNRVGAVGEIIDSGVNGLIADNDEQYAEYLDLLLTDKATRERLGASARKKVEQCFNWHSLVGKYITLYKEALNVRG